MLVWHLKYVRPATELVLKTNLFLYLNHKLKRSPPDAAWQCKMLIAVPSSHTSIKSPCNLKTAEAVKKVDNMKPLQ